MSILGHFDQIWDFFLKCSFPVEKFHFTISGKCATLLFHTHHKCYLNFYSKYRFQLSFLCCIFQQASYVLIILVVDIIVFIITTIIPQLLCQIANYVTYHLAFTNTTLGTLCTYYKITKKLATPVELNFFRFPRNSLVMLRKGIMFLALRWRHVSASNAPDVRKNMNYLANWSSGTSTWKICRVKIVDSSRGSYFHIYVHSSCKWTFWKWWYYCSWCWIYQMKNSSSSPGMLTLWCFYKKLGYVIRENIFINLWLWITTWKFSHIFQTLVKQ